ncbi:MAG: tRNA uridine-5-carboxymethylaminomethyl(34) synthesis GTPase MnmE [Acutalibacteraceae bacterium]|nr:tRNA uridine-5-carboxymethylaminomethyl(34) synthesis GTPase MnmE [Acutalibacteraceae bacterium]CDA20209.1 tRNA modification GTPase MnmE [Ruminococcus sp. CAG:488]
MSDLSAIAAISTPLGTGGVGIIRISGKNATEIADRIFVSVNGIKLSSSKGYRAYFGRIFDGETAVDEVVCLVFRAPHSYTGEDVVEINCHGGVVLLKKILRLVLQNGAQAAAPGEFTKRAFLNGKLDLSEAESVMTLISAQGEQGANAAFNQLEGSLSRKIEKINSSLLSLAAHIAAWVDYPDDEIEELGNNELYSTIYNAYLELCALLSNFDSGMAVTNGVEAAIVGKPNVGKSTLMNLLTGYDRSIVTEIEGTTRDVVEETVNLNGCILRISDTAGMRETGDIVEKLGVERSRKKLERAAIVFAVFDLSKPLSDEDKELIDECKDKNVIPIINKTDLEPRLDVDYIKNKLGSPLFISAKSGDGYNELCDRVAELMGTKNFDTTSAMLVNERQRICCQKASDALKDALEALNIGLTPDAIGVCIDDAIAALLELTGQKASEAVVDEVFKQFCVGK